MFWVLFTMKKLTSSTCNVQNNNMIICLFLEFLKAVNQNYRNTIFHRAWCLINKHICDIELVILLQASKTHIKLATTTKLAIRNYCCLICVLYGTKLKCQWDLRWKEYKYDSLLRVCACWEQYRIITAHNAPVIISGHQKAVAVMRYESKK